MKLLATSIVHPAAVLRGAFNEKPLQIIYLRRALEMCKDGYEAPERPPAAPRGSNTDPTIEQILRYLRDAPGTTQAVDLEAAGHHITIIGLRNCESLEGITIRFRLCGGQLGMSRSELSLVVSGLYDFFADSTIAKVYQNGQAYDIIEQLERIGFVHRGYAFDTMLAAFIAFPEMRKGLEDLGVTYAGLAGWKYLSKAEAEGEGK